MSVTVGMSPPRRSLDQRFQALRIANEIRSRRAQLKRDIAAGAVRVLDVIDEQPEYAATMRVFELLIAVPSIGRVKANRILSQSRIAPSKTLGGITGDQRERLRAALAARPRVTGGAA